MRAHVLHPHFRILVRVTSIVASLLWARNTFALSFIPATGVLGTCNFLTGDIHFDCVPLYLGYLIEVFILIGAGFFLGGFLFAGYRYIISPATGQGTEGARKQLFWNIGGFVIMILSFLIVDTIINVLVP